MTNDVPSFTLSDAVLLRTLVRMEGMQGRISHAYSAENGAVSPDNSHFKLIGLKNLTIKRVRCYPAVTPSLG